jgi:hypothetical protein
MYKKWLKRYLTESERLSHPYEKWKAIKLAKKPKMGQPSDYNQFFKTISDKLKAVIEEIGLQVRHFRYIPLLAETVKEILEDYKQQIELQQGQKLRAEDYDLLRTIDIRGLPNFKGLLQLFAKDKILVNSEFLNSVDYSAFRPFSADLVISKRPPVEKKPRKKRTTKGPGVLTRGRKRRTIVRDDSEDSDDEFNRLIEDQMHGNYDSYGGGNLDRLENDDLGIIGDDDDIDDEFRRRVRSQIRKKYEEL